MDHRVVNGLPTDGPPAISFSETGSGKHAEGLVVQFALDDGTSWVGNFIGGISGLNQVIPHPDGSKAIVVSRGQAYVVDPVLRQVIETFGGALGAFWHAEAFSAIIFESSGVEFIAVGPSGVLWRSRRVSWDGFRALRLDADKLSGEAWSFDESWHPFQLHVSSGHVIGGAYSELGGVRT